MNKIIGIIDLIIVHHVAFLCMESMHTPNLSTFDTSSIKTMNGIQLQSSEERNGFVLETPYQRSKNRNYTNPIHQLPFVTGYPIPCLRVGKTTNNRLEMTPTPSGRTLSASSVSRLGRG